MKLYCCHVFNVFVYIENDLLEWWNDDEWRYSRKGLCCDLFAPSYILKKGLSKLVAPNNVHNSYIHLKCSNFK